MEGNHILITGGAGFLGSHVARLLLQNGNRVTILDDFSNGKELHLEAIKDHQDLKVVRGDITDAETVAETCQGVDVLMHLAVLGLRQSIKEPRRVNDVIIDGTLNCLEAARASGVGLFLNCSSSEAYGSAQYVPMDEKHPLLPETPYAAAKVAQDMYVSAYGRTYGLPWTTIRPFNMYGPHSHWQGYRGELIPKMIVRAMNEKPLVLFGDGLQTRDFLYVEEAARAVVAVAENSECMGATINFCTGKETTIRRIAELICEQFGLEPDRTIEHQEGRPGDVRRHLGDSSRFQELVGFKPEVSIDEGIKRTVDWFKGLPMKPEELLAQEKLRSWE